MPPRSAPAATLGSDDGQASVELVALLPLLGVIGLLGWQAVVAGQAAWLAAAAARAGARAAAVGRDPEAAARGWLTPALERGLVVEAGDRVVVRVVIRSVLGGHRLATVDAGAAFPEQSS